MRHGAGVFELAGPRQPSGIQRGIDDVPPYPFGTELAAAGFEPREWWTDDGGRYALSLWAIR